MATDSEATSKRLKDSIRLLIGKRPPAYADEPAIRLVELQAWIHFPDEDDAEIVRTAARHAGKVFLRSAERKLASPARPPGSAAALRHLLSIPEYAALFDDAIFNTGGWARPDRVRTILALEEASKRAEENEIVTDLVDFLMRDLEHGSKGKHTNIARAFTFCWKDPSRISYQWKSRPQKVATIAALSRLRERASGTTFRRRWSAAKDSAAFIYVSEKFGPAMFLEIASLTTAARIRRQVPEPKRLSHFFGICAYVNEKLLQISSGGVSVDSFPPADELRRVRPRHAAFARSFSPDEEKRISQHSEWYPEFQNN